MQSLYISSHPLVARDITILRDKKTDTHEFRRVLDRLTQSLAYESSHDIPLQECFVETPLETTKGFVPALPIILVPVLRAGLGMLNSFLEIFPDAKVGHIGLYRNEETLDPVEYYSKYPETLSHGIIFLLDPMLATGGSANAAISVLKNGGAKHIRLVCIVAAPEGVERVKEKNPDVVIYTAAYDRGLNENGYIIPGLGDAGDRIFGTEKA